MRTTISLLAVASFVICIATFAAESKERHAIVGTWSLTKSVDGKIVDERSSQKLSPTPEGAGFVYLDDGEIRVPGERTGSKRFTVPRGFHFRIEPKTIDERRVIADVLLSYTDLKSESEIGFATESRQVDGRYEITFDAPYSVTLSLPEVETKYTLTVKLSRGEVVDEP